jgi:hypothetical protein
MELETPGSNRSGRRWRLGLRPAWLVALAAVAISGYKLLWAEAASRAVLGCQWCAAHKAVPHELQWLMGLLLLHLASLALRANAKWAAAALRLVVLAAVLAAADLFVLQQFLTRLTYGEAMKFVGEPQAVRGFVAHLAPLTAALALAAAAAGLFVAWAYVGDGGRAGRRSPLWPAAAAMAGMIGAAAAKVDDQHTPYLQNSVEAFFASQSRQREYSAGFAARVRPRAPDPERCFDGLATRPDIVVLMVESLSMYHSQRLSGLANWTPELDRIGAAGTTFRSFFANGIISEQGFIALLTGEPPIERPGWRGRTLYEAFMATPDTVPKLLKRSGYEARFISGFNLDFPGMHPWLRAVGFDRVEGQEAPFFAGKSTVRLHFDSVPDELLFERLLHELSLPRTAPLFLTSFTQSTHHPYTDPSTGARTEEAAFRYADRALGRFVDALRERRYFDQGYLLIVGDHRAMQPMGSRERQRFGDRGFARVPMVVLGPGQPAPHVVAAAFSQTDLLPTLRHLVGRERACLAPDQGIFLPTERAAPACIYTLRPYNPNRVYAHCGGTDAVVELDGDQTRYVGPPPPAHHDVLGVVNRLRLGRGF